MSGTAMTDYAATYRSFRWEVPAHFNFGADVVDAWAADAAKPALIWCDAEGHERRLTFVQVARLSNRFANLLQGHGVGKGDRVIVMLPRIPEWQIVMVGCTKLGAVPVPCVTMLTEGDIAYRVSHSEAVAAVTTDDNVHKFPDQTNVRCRVSVGGGAGWLDFEDAIGGASDTFDAVSMAGEDPAILYYTSGSTGEPKGAMHAARGLYAWRGSARYWLGLGADDLMWCTADTGWSKAGTSILFGPWSQGAEVLFYDGPFEPAVRLEMLSSYRVTVFCAAATEFRRLIAEDVGSHDLSSLKLAVSAGEALNPEIVERWQALSGVPLLDGYGQTETLMTVLNYPRMPVKAGSMGRPLPGTEVAVIDDGGAFAGAGQPGQLAVRLPNPQQMLGYWKEPEKTAAAVIKVDGDQWFLTGDNAYRDEDGYFFYLGRADDVISSAGYRIGPQEVENALMEHPAVQECAAVGSPDAERGEVVKAFIILHAGFTASEQLTKELRDHAKRTTAPYKYPRRIAFVDELPKTVTGKIRRRVLRDREYAGEKL